MADDVFVPLLTNSSTCQSREERTSLGIIGTGNYAVALSKRLTMAGYEIIMGSRHPQKRELNLKFSSDCLCGSEVTSISECLKKCHVIFVVIHVEDFETTLKMFVKESKGKILIDVSNREHRYAARSNAEKLASILPHAIVVKAFNSISAYTMEDVATSAGNHRVFVASNDSSARSLVGDIAKTMGFRVVDLGGLKSAIYMEDFVLKVFSHWKVPILLTFGIFNLWLLYVVYLYFIETTEFQWEQVFLKVLNKPLCMTAITVLALTYFPGHVASILQIYNGTKHKRFPRALDTWLKSRKQLGLISFLLVIVHVIASVLMMSPTYYSTWFHRSTVTLPANTTLNSDLVIPVSTSWMVWKGEAATLVGIAAFILMSIIGLTSIPSVGESLNWSEWRCVHSNLSYMVLLLAVAHVCIMGAPGWVKDGPIKTLKSITCLSILLPFLVLLLKFLFMCPPLNGYIWKIRRGWERSSASQPSLPVAADEHRIKMQYDISEVSKQNGMCKSCDCCNDSSHGSVSVNGSRDTELSVKVQCECSTL